MKKPDDPFTLLATVQHKHGRTLTQFKRVGNVAMFLLSGGGFEIVRIRVKEAQKVPGGKIIPRREAYPSDEEFGTFGWYYSQKEADLAEQKFQACCTKFNP